MLRSVRFFTLFALAHCVAFASSAKAEYMTQAIELDQSSHFGNGVVYGSVLIEAYDGNGGGGGLDAGQVRITFDAQWVSAYGDTGDASLLGISAVGFNTSLDLKHGQIKGPKEWAPKTNEHVDGFGLFLWSEQSVSGQHPYLPVTILISGLGTDAIPEHFLIGSTLSGDDAAGISASFAARVAAGDDSFQTHWIGNKLGVDVGDTGIHPSPEPATLTMAAFAMGGLGLIRCLRRRKE